ncbi:MAG: site-specific integrase [Rikenellaceae bacterium]|nr:site-specific integrase [Rikenellaceae bacterium]
MEQDNRNYDYEDDYGYENDSNKSLKGYKMVIVLLVIILAGVSGLYFMQTKQLKEDFAIERDTLTYQLSVIRTDFENLKTTNDTITYNLNVERNRADSLIQQLKKERSISRATIRKYQKEVGTLRSIMKDYVRQIDSLNTLNQKLISENVSYRKQITATTQRAEMAEEKADEMALKIRQGSVIRVRDIKLLMLNANDKEVTRSSRAARLRVDMVLSANDIAMPGARNVYVRITAPDGYIMATEESKTFEYQGDALIYSATREVDYQNSDLSVSVYYNGSGITGGEYLVEVYVDGHMAGELKTLLR